MDALSTIETLKAKVKTFKEGPEIGGSMSLDRDRQAKVGLQATHLKGIRDTEEVEIIMWHLENYFKYIWVKSDKYKINTTVFYLSEMTMLWCRHK